MIQIDMEMPSCCYDCDFSIGVMSTKAERECTITDKYVNDDDKPEWCPLIEVPDNNEGMNKTTRTNFKICRNCNHLCITGVKLVKERWVPIYICGKSHKEVNRDDPCNDETSVR